MVTVIQKYHGVPIDARRGDALEGYEKKENIDAKYTT